MAQNYCCISPYNQLQIVVIPGLLITTLLPFQDITSQVFLKENDYLVLPGENTNWLWQNYSQ